MSEYFAFIWPWMLLSLLAAPGMVWLYRRLRRRQAQQAAELGPLGLVQNRSGRHGPPLLYGAGLTLLLLALARPQATVSLPRIQGTVILAFDISNSMMAEDLEPARLDAAKDAARTFVDNQPSTIRIGIVAFGSGALIVQEPTDDRAEILSAIDRLSVQGGTSLGEGIFTSLNAIAGERIAINEEAIDAQSGALDAEQLRIEDYSSAVVLLLTDGENTDAPEPTEIAQVAAEAGVRIYTVGLGSEEGARIEVDGFTLATRLDEALLQEIAGITNGAYFHAADRESLQAIYDNVDLQLKVDAEMMEVTALFAAAGMIFLLAGGLLSMLWLGRAP